MSAARSLTLEILPNTLAVCRLSPNASIPSWAVSGDFFTISRTPDELSVVCAERSVPGDVKAERGWRCLKVQGPLDFVLTGVLASLATPLADAEVGIFAISTFDTDYLLVKEADLRKSVTILSEAGHQIREVIQ